MSNPLEAKESFTFYTRLSLPELTGLRASSLTELIEHLKEIPGSSIYHHTHRFLLQHQYLSPEPPNDFAFWVTNSLGEDILAEQLASIDTVQYSSIRALREKIIATLENYLRKNPESANRRANPGEEFHFIKSVSFILSTGYVAHDLPEFAEILSRITIDSIYYHVFEARLRLDKRTHDFSNWIENSIGDKVLANSISKMDPYTCTLEDLRGTIIRAVKKRIGRHDKN